MSSVVKKVSFVVEEDGNMYRYTEEIRKLNVTMERGVIDLTNEEIIDLTSDSEEEVDEVVDLAEDEDENITISSNDRSPAYSPICLPDVWISVSPEVWTPTSQRSVSPAYFLFNDDNMNNNLSRLSPQNFSSSSHTASPAPENVVKQQ